MAPQENQWVDDDASGIVRGQAPRESQQQGLIEGRQRGEVVRQRQAVFNEGLVNNLKKNNEYPFGESISMLKPGKYGLYVSVGSRDGTPVIALPLNCRNDGRRYELGEIVVAPPKTVHLPNTTE